MLTQVIWALNYGVTGCIRKLIIIQPSEEILQHYSSLCQVDVLVHMISDTIINQPLKSVRCLYLTPLIPLS